MWVFIGLETSGISLTCRINPNPILRLIPARSGVTYYLFHHFICIFSTEKNKNSLDSSGSSREGEKNK